MQVNSSPTLVLLILLTSLLFSCGHPEQSEKKLNQKKVGESLIKANKSLVKTEDQQIEDFIKRYGWKMNETGTGLRYMIYKEGSGIKAEFGKKVTIKYSLRFLSGDECYTSDEMGNKEFIIGQGGVEPGLEEGILFLKKGDRAKFILPSHLGFGLVGDGNKIPAKATLVYDVELLELK
jgi:FKBP-type peptidyl-prolyl cis-trans isomerase FkpA